MSQFWGIFQICGLKGDRKRVCEQPLPFHHILCHPVISVWLCLLCCPPVWHICPLWHFAQLPCPESQHFSAKPYPYSDPLWPPEDGDLPVPGMWKHTPRDPPKGASEKCSISRMGDCMTNPVTYEGLGKDILIKSYRLCLGLWFHRWWPELNCCMSCQEYNIQVSIDIPWYTTCICLVSAF